MNSSNRHYTGMWVPHPHPHAHASLLLILCCCVNAVIASLEHGERWWIILFSCAISRRLRGIDSEPNYLGQIFRCLFDRLRINTATHQNYDAFCADSIGLEVCGGKNLFFHHDPIALKASIPIPSHILIVSTYSCSESSHDFSSNDDILFRGLHFVQKNRPVSNQKRIFMHPLIEVRIRRLYEFVWSMSYR